jgi:hypothetical protein
MSKLNENITQLIINNLYLNELAIFKHNTKNSSLLIYLIKANSDHKVPLLYTKTSYNTYNLIYNNFRYENQKNNMLLYTINDIKKLCADTFVVAFSNKFLGHLRVNNNGLKLSNVKLSGFIKHLYVIDEEAFISLNMDGVVRLWNISKNKPDIELISNNCIYKFIAHMSNDTLISVDHSYLLQFWDMRRGCSKDERLVNEEFGG